MKLKIERVKVVRLRPGDYVIAECGPDVSVDSAMTTVDSLKKEFPKQHVFGTFGDLRLRFARPVKE